MSSTATVRYIAGTWDIDTQNSEVGFSVRHLGVATVRGRLNAVTGTIVTGPTIEESSITAVISANSIDTGYADRDTYIKGDAVLAADQNPELRFSSTAVRRHDDGFVVDGELTVRGTTVPVSMPVEIGGFGDDRMAGRTVVGLSAELVVDRAAFGLATKIPSAVIGDRIALRMDVQATLSDS